MKFLLAKKTKNNLKIGIKTYTTIEEAKARQSELKKIGIMLDIINEDEAFN